MSRRVYPYLLVSLGFHLALLALLLLLKGPQLPEVRERRVVVQFARKEQAPLPPPQPSRTAQIVTPERVPLSASLDPQGPRRLPVPPGRLTAPAPASGGLAQTAARADLPLRESAMVPSAALPVPPPDLAAVLQDVPRSAVAAPAGGASAAAAERGYLDQSELEWKGRERKVLKAARPEFPDILLQEGQEVDVEALFTVEPSGQVTRVEITRSSGYNAVDRTVERTLMGYLFEPSTDESQDTGRIVFRFRLERRN
jgi:TonB family protein